MKQKILGELKARVKAKFGGNIDSKPACLSLQASILKITNEYLSVSTLQRFFELVKPLQPSKTTLDILANYIQYPSFNAFEEECKSLFYSTLKNDSSKVILNYIIDSLQNESLDIKSFSLFIDRLSEAIHKKDKKITYLVFENQDFLDLIKTQKTYLDYASQKIGLIIQNEPFDNFIEELLQNKGFFELIVLQSVDIQNKFWHRYYQKLLEANTFPKHKDFLCSVVSLNFCYWEDLEMSKHYFNQIEISATHSPELSGRIALLNLVLNKDKHLLFSLANHHAEFINLFSMDLMSYWLINEDKKWINIWFDKYQTQLFIENEWISKETKFIYTLCSLLLKDENAKILNLLEKAITRINTNTMLRQLHSHFSVN